MRTSAIIINSNSLTDGGCAKFDWFLSAVEYSSENIDIFTDYHWFLLRLVPSSSEDINIAPEAEIHRFILLRVLLSLCGLGIRRIGVTILLQALELR